MILGNIEERELGSALWRTLSGGGGNSTAGYIQYHAAHGNNTNRKRVMGSIEGFVAVISLVSESLKVD